MKTLTWYRSLLKKFSTEIAQNDMSSITPTHIRAYLVGLREEGLSDASVHGHTRALHRFFKWCEIEYEMPNPMRNVRYPKQPRAQKPKAVSVNDVITLLDACDHRNVLGWRDKAMIAFLIDTGCRAAGICGLQMEDLDLDGQSAYIVEKGGKGRTAFFSSFTAELIDEWMRVRNDRSPYVFHNQDGNKLQTDGLGRMLQRLKVRAGITGRVNPHAFRHGFAIEYLRDGGSLVVLSRILGHESIKVTADSYGIFAQEDLRREHELHTPMNKIQAARKDREQGEDI